MYFFISGHLCLILTSFAFADTRLQQDESSESCGGILEDMTGVIQSPYFTENYYPDSTTCIWRISLQDKKKSIQIKFDSFKLEKSDNCRYDHLVIYDANRPREDKVIGRFCGDKSPGILNSTGSELYLRFESDGSVSKLGFKLRYKALSGCDKRIVSSNGSITSPGYPVGYPPSAVCRYEIIVPESGRVKFSFVDLQTEDHAACQFDFVELYDGYEAEETSLGRFCGSEIPDGPIRTTGNVLLVKFASDLSVKKRGFKANFQGETPLRCRENNGGCEQNCTELEYSRICSCRDGYQLDTDGVSCKDLDECVEKPYICDGGCTNTIGSYHCSCQPGFHMNPINKKCQDIDECKGANHNCTQLCVNTIGSFTCECKKGFAKNQGKCLDINECAKTNVTHFCSQGCVNTPGSYFCYCNSGYELSTNKRTCKDINECLHIGIRCEQSCVNLPGSYRCTCLPGYKVHPLLPHKCIDIDECLGDLRDCHNCINTAGSYFCECEQGYIATKSKLQCIDKDECKSDNGGCKFDCVNTPGSHYCKCFDGYKPIDKLNSSCIDINECESNQGKGECEQICTNTPGSFKCACRKGYAIQPDQRSCIDIDECEKPVCHHQCINLPGNYTCKCLEGFKKIHDQSCVDIDECVDGAHKCDDLAICNNTAGGYDCVCPPGYILHNKTTCLDINECEDTTVNKCEHQCLNVNGSFICKCEKGFTLQADGKKCQDIDECHPSKNTCINAEKCRNFPGGFECICQNGLQLAQDNVTCIDVDECLVDNGGCEQFCNNSYQSFNCSCANGFDLDVDGRKCVDVDECAKNISCCTQICKNKDGGFACQCKNGFVLANDSCTCRDIDECSVSNGGCQQACVNEQGSYRCKCYAGFNSSGEDFKKCHDINECSLGISGCEQQCINTPGSFNCSCNGNYKLGTDRKTCQACPNCAEFESLKKMVVELQEKVQQLLKQTAKRSNTCILKDKNYDKIFQHGSTWEDETACLLCECKNGVIECKTKQCKTSNAGIFEIS